MPTISRILELAPTSCYLSNNAKAKGSLFKNNVPQSLKNQATLIYIYWKILNKIYTLDPDYDGLQAPANYLYELEQSFAFKAANIVDGGGGGQISPATPTTLPTPYYFIVDDNSFIANGETTKTFPASWQGYNMVFARGGVTQTDVTSEPSYFTWDSQTLEFTCEPAAVTSELFAIIPT